MYVGRIYVFLLESNEILFQAFKLSDTKSLLYKYATLVISLRKESPVSVSYLKKYGKYFSF